MSGVACGDDCGTRVVIAEALLIGLVSVALGFAAGMVMTFDAHKLWANTIGFEPDLLIPWWVIAFGSGVVVVIAIVASTSVQNAS